MDDSPGPGNYEPHFDKVLPKSREALILGPKNRQSYIREGNEPGPGHYEEDKVLSSSMSARGVGFGQTKRTTEFDTVVAKKALSPGPGAYAAAEGRKDVGPTFGAKRPEKVSLNPGPGTYNLEEADLARRPQTAKANAFGLSKKPDIWKEEKNKTNLGPAYDLRSSFDATKNKGPALRGKVAVKVEASPGPGAYNNHNQLGLTKKKEASVKIGATKRPDNFTKEQKDLPGPGNYMQSTDTFGKDVKGASMGSKYKATVSDTPGPGQYSGEDYHLKAAKVNCKIGTSKRPDIWEKEAKNDQPGPGNYLESTGTFGNNAKRGATMGSKHSASKNDNPGPGQYDPSDLKAAIRPHSTYGKIGTAKRADIWSADKQAREGVPGPGAHTTSYSSFTQVKVNSFGLSTGRRDERNNNPGPGQYDQLGRTLTHTKSNSVRFGSAKKPDIWEKDKRVEAPGPGNYNDTNTFGKAVKGGATMGSKFKPEVNSNPGPGQYDSEAKEKVKGSKIGSAARPALWDKETKDDKPGPGNYMDDTNTFGKAAKSGAGMGSKYKPERNENPGPGQYDGDAIKNKKSCPNTKLSQAQRTDIWAEQTKQAQPGPGNYAVDSSTFNNAKGGATMGSKFKAEVNSNPGPGQYSVSDAQTKKSAGN